MEKKVFEEKREDYIALFESMGEFLKMFEDYTPEKKDMLDKITKTACSNAQDIPGGETLFKNVSQYILYRYEEMEKYKERRRKMEAAFIQSLPDIFDSLAVPSETSCMDLAEWIAKLSDKSNYQILMEGTLAEIASL